jgi:hypothetical protein
MSATPAAIHKHESRVIAWLSCIGDESMQSYLCIGGNHDGLNYPAHADAETIEWPVGITVSLRLAGAFTKFQTAPLYRRHTFI